MECRTEQINKWTNRSKQKVKKHLSLVYFSASKCFKKSFVNRVPILSEYPKFVMREGDTFFLIRRGFGTFGHSISVLLDTGKRRSRTAATSKMERFVIVIIIIGFLPLTIITKRSILDVSAVLDPPLQGNMFLEVNSGYSFIFCSLWHFTTKCYRYYYKMWQLFYHKMRQKVITKCVRYFIPKCVRRLLQTTSVEHGLYQHKH